MRSELLFPLLAVDSKGYNEHIYNTCICKAVHINTVLNIGILSLSLFSNRKYITNFKKERKKKKTILSIYAKAIFIL